MDVMDVEMCSPWIGRYLTGNHGVRSMINRGRAGGHEDAKQGLRSAMFSPRK